MPASRIHEMDWWKQAVIKGVAIHNTPARHYAGRKSMDTATLWTSWMIEGPSHSACCSGDTGYAPHFADIRNGSARPSWRC